MASCENKYTTLLDLSRQAKVITGETACFDGKIEVGIPFSGYPTGVDTGTTVSLGVVSSETAVFSGNTGTTVFDVSNTGSTNYNALFSGFSGTVWTNALFSGNTSGLTLPITTLSADTQIVGPFWTLTQTGMTGDYVIGTQYTGYSITYAFSQVEQMGIITGYTAYSGFTSASQENFSAGTLDYKGPLDYISSVEDASIDGRLTTKKLSVTDGASASTIGYVLTQIDEYGRVGWVFNSASGGTGTSGAFTSTTSNNRIITTNALGNSVSSDYSSILGGDGNTVNLNSTRSIIVGGRNSDVEGEYSFIGNGLTNSITGRGFWNTIINGENNDLSLDPSSNYNTLVGNSHSITGTSLIANSILGGQSNSIHSSGIDPINSSIVGGNNNLIYGPDRSSIVGGQSNTIDGESNNTSIIGGENNNILLVSTSSFIGGGENNTLSNTTNSAIIGGDSITGTSSNTVYVPNLNISTLGTGTSVNNLGIDSSGNVVTGTTGGGGGVTIDPYNNSGSGTTISWDVSGTSTNYESTLTGNTTLDLINVRNGDYGTLITHQDGAGSHTLTFNNINGGAGTHYVVNGGGGTPTLTSNPNAIDILSFTYNGSAMYWTVGNDYT
tara:strand:- start:2045 stop:3874 length:1830 start_codon:yes stop_codon:yes gene_type:complete